MASLQPHHRAVLERLLNQEQQELFTDLKVCLQDGTVHASRVLLSAISDPFTQMLSANMVEAQQRVLNLPHVTVDTWKCVFQFYFSNRDCVNDANALNVLQFSHMYQLNALQEHCYSYLRRNCSLMNCLAVWRQARVLGLDPLTTQSLQVICKNFLSVGKEEDFVDLTFEELCELLGNGDLVTIEDELCSALLRWIAENNASDDVAVTIFNHIQLQNLSSAMLTKLAGIRRIQKSASVSAKLAQEQDKIRKSGSPRVCPTTPSRRVGPEEVTVVVGHDFYNLCIYTWFPGSQRWSLVCKYEYPDRFACLKHRDTIIITGGWVDIEAADTTLLFDLKTATLSPGRKLRQCRYFHGMAAVDDMVFVVGGREIMGCRVSCIERCDAIGTRFSWKTVGDMSGHFKNDYSFKRDVGGVATVGRNLIVSLVHSDEGTRFLSFNADTSTSSLLPLQLPVYDFFRCSTANCADEAFFLFGNGSLHRFSETPDHNILHKGSLLLEGFRNEHGFTLFSDGCSLLVFENIRKDPACPVRCYSLEGLRLQSNDLPALPVGMDMMGAFLTRSLKV